MEIIKTIMEIQQSPPYASYIKSLGWQVEKIDGSNLFLKHFPLLGGFAKLQRCTKLPETSKLFPVLSKYHVKRLSVEPDSGIPQHTFSAWVKIVSSHVQIISTHYISTKTIRVNLVQPEEKIFSQFTEAKRRAVRRAQNAEISVTQSSDINALLKIKNKSAGFLGFITTFGTDKLWPLFAPDHADILLAPTSNVIARSFTTRQSLEIASPSARNDDRIVGGILLLFWDHVAYYWIAGATKEGKRMFAPTLLVWEALKLAKKRGMKTFDFIGVWDERIPKENKAWLGFTKFKEGFGGKSLYYPIATPRR